MEKVYKILKLLILILAIAVVIVGAYVLYDALQDQVQLDALATQPPATAASDGAENSVPVENAAPDFTVYDRDGAEYKLSDFKGKPVVLNFWASWCGPCKSEMPDFEAAYKKYGEEIHFLMVNLTDGSQETLESASKYVDSQGYTFPVYYDSALSAAITYGVNAVPITYFLDAEGNLVAHGQGALTAESLQRGIDMIYSPA